MALEAVKRRGVVNEAFPYLASLMFSMLHSLDETIKVYKMKDEELGDWAEVTKFHL